MERNMESSGGCCVVVACRMGTHPLRRQEKTGSGTLPPLLEDTRGNPARGREGPYPVFELGTWRFTVKTRDPRLIGDLGDFAREMENNPRAHVRFTCELVRCTEQGRLPGWAWRKEGVTT